MISDNHQFVMQWLVDRCSNSGVIRVSNSEIALVFGWSQPYAKKILSKLIQAGYLEELQKGTGHRATKYRVSFSHNRHPSSHNQGVSPGHTPQNASQHVPSHNQRPSNDASAKKVFPFRHTKTTGQARDNAQTVAHVQNIFDNFALRVRHTVKPSSSPFKRFQQRSSVVESWNTTDFVCYYSHVYKVRFGDLPKLEWKKECGAARNLLKRLHDDRVAFKTFIQIAFAICKKRPDGLYTFSFGKFYEEIIERELDEAILDEYDDGWVFPWLAEERKRKGREATREYINNQTLRSLGIYS